MGLRRRRRRRSDGPPPLSAVRAPRQGSKARPHAQVHTLVLHTLYVQLSRVGRVGRRNNGLPSRAQESSARCLAPRPLLACTRQGFWPCAHHKFVGPQVSAASPPLGRGGVRSRGNPTLECSRRSLSFSQGAWRGARAGAPFSRPVVDPFVEAPNLAPGARTVRLAGCGQVQVEK